ncbi:P-loop containing nucleoside triphosphate hydrolase protein [Phycomyces nitens]|nr:P-loop containing nucleoside triphosphate hydrolase protein [Phycomyces nitens]
MSILESKGLSMQLDDGRWLFKDIDIELEKGDILVLRGQSGAGKTTLLKALAELIPYTSGGSKLFGKSPQEYGIPQWRAQVMYVPQRPAIHPGTPLDLFETVKKYASQKGKTFGDPVKIGMDWNLSESHFRERWSHLSGGEMQRAALAVALALNSEILLLDEPTSALDPESTLLVEQTLRTRTCVWITHNPQQEERVATKSLVLYRLSKSPLASEDLSDGATEIDMPI